MAVLWRMTLAHAAVAVDVGISQAALANRHIARRTTRIERVDHDFDNIFSVPGWNDEFAVLRSDCLADHLARSVDQLHFLVGEGPITRLILQLRAGTAGRKADDAVYSRLNRFPRGRSYPAHGPGRRTDQANKDNLFSQNVHGVRSWLWLWSKRIRKCMRGKLKRRHLNIGSEWVMLRRGLRLSVVGYAEPCNIAFESNCYITSPIAAPGTGAAFQP